MVFLSKEAINVTFYDLLLFLFAHNCIYLSLRLLLYNYLHLFDIKMMLHNFTCIYSSHTNCNILVVKSNLSKNYFLKGIYSPYGHSCRSKQWAWGMWRDNCGLLCRLNATGCQNVSQLLQDDVRISLIIHEMASSLCCIKVCPCGGGFLLRNGKLCRHVTGSEFKLHMHILSVFIYGCWGSLTCFSIEHWLKGTL